MTSRFGIDTSILMRLLTGDPEPEFERCILALEKRIGDGAEIYAGAMVIAESYIALQHHYGIGKADAREALISVLESGWVTPLGGKEVFEVLRSGQGCGLVDRLIALSYQTEGLMTLTLDLKMSRLPRCLSL